MPRKTPLRTVAYTSQAIRAQSAIASNRAKTSPRAKLRLRSRGFGGVGRGLVMMNTTFDPEALLTPEQAAKRLRVRPNTLQDWRVTGRYGLKFVKTGRLVRYREEDIRAFIARRTQDRTVNSEA